MRYARGDGKCHSSVSIRIFRFSRSTCGWNHDCGEIALGGQLPEGRQIAALQILPAAEQLSALPLQFLELKLLGFGWSCVSAADVDRKERQLGVDLRRIGERIFVRADGEVDQLIAHCDQFFLEIIG